MDQIQSRSVKYYLPASRDANGLDMSGNHVASKPVYIFYRDSTSTLKKEEEEDPVMKLYSKNDVECNSIIL